MNITNISLMNYKGIENLDIDFKPGINVLIGDNGAGKSSVLTATRMLVSEMLYLINGEGIKHFKQSDTRVDVNVAGDATLVFEKHWPVVISGKLSFEDKEYSLYREKANEGISEISNNTQVYKIYTDLIKNTGSSIPILNYQRFDRDWMSASKKQKELTGIKTGMTDRVDGLRGCLDGNGCDDIVSEWCLKMSMIEFERHSSVNEFTVFKSIIARFIKAIMDIDEDVEIYYSIAEGGLVLGIGQEKNLIYNLSTGYRAILSLVMELAYRTVVLNPNFDDSLAGLEGIVMVDEIDAHLHPIWQWKIIDALEETFPKVQFIVATHSPIILSSAKNAHIIKLDDLSKVSYLESGYGLSADEILELRQGADSIPAEFRYYQNLLEESYDKGDEESKKVLKDAKEKFGEKSIIYNNLLNDYKVNSWIDEDVDE